MAKRKRDDEPVDLENVGKKGALDFEHAIDDIWNEQDSFPDPIVYPPGTCQNPRDCTLPNCNCLQEMPYTEAVASNVPDDVECQHPEGCRFNFCDCYTKM